MVMKRILTLVFLVREDEILLGYKKRGFGVGLWNGFGGKVHDGEDIEEAALRELEEETTLVATDLTKHGIINFYFENDPEVLEVHVFSAMQFVGEPQETEEMRPQWFDIGEIPYREMWPDDKFFLPLLLEGKRFGGDCHYKDKKTLLRSEIKEID